MNRKFKKIIPYILVLLILVGLFSPMAQVSAQETLGSCESYIYSGNSEQKTVFHNVKAGDCPEETGSPDTVNEWVPYSTTNPAPPTNTLPTKTTTQLKPIQTSPTTSGDFRQEISAGCKITNLTGCILFFFYWTYFQIPTLLLTLSANLFNAMVPLTIDSTLMKESTFISESWAIVRDLSNIFFILILLYVAIQTILGLGHEAKKVIVWVVIMALLINFSMFFTKVVIDSSNILALVFYNKLEVNKVRQNAYEKSTTLDIEKDISGEIVDKFNPTKLLSKESLEKLKTISISGKKIEAKEDLPFGLTLALMFIAGSIMLFSAFAFFVAGAAFLARLLELWVLIIFSPFAFMSFTLPKLKGIEYLGWDAWFKRLIKTSFMAPIFMFFMYLIFKLLNAYANLDILTDNGFIGYILSLILPALMAMYLLLKAVKFAKEGAGKFGEIASSVGKMVGGLALGAATGGTSMAVGAVGRATLGRAGSAMANSGWARKWESKGRFGEYFRRGATSLGSASFDVRGAKIAGKTLGGVTGIPVGEAQKGGFMERTKEQVKKRQERAKGLEVGENETLKQNLNKTEADLQRLLNENSKELSELDKLITKKKEELRDTAARFGGGSDQAKQAGLDLQNVKDRKKALKDGSIYLGDKDLAGNVTGANAKNYINFDAGTYEDSDGTIRNKSINYLEDIELRDRKHAIEAENRKRKWRYAKTTESGLGQLKDFILSGGQHSFAGAREAAHKTRMEAKIESGKEDRSHGGGGHASTPAPTPRATPPSAHGGTPPAAGGQHTP